MPIVNPRRRRIAIGVVALAVAAVALVWYNRWHIGRTAIQIADPLVRAWAANQVLEGSDSAYRLVASPIRVDERRRRISVDSIVVTTDTATNGRLPHPHPAVTLRFRRCALTGIDLTGLASGAGLHALHAGCDTASLSMRSLVAPVDTGVTVASADSNNFLRFQGKVDLPAGLPHVAVDLFEFPHVHVAFDLLGADGRRTALTADSIAIRLDSILIDPAQPVAQRRPLFSRDVTVRLDHFEGTTKSGGHLALQHLTANLEDGTSSLDDVLYEPQPGKHGRATGVSQLRLRHVHSQGTGWRGFLLQGDVAIHTVTIDSTLVRSVVASQPRNAPHAVHPPMTPPELALRGIGRRVRLDSIVLKSVTIVAASPSDHDSSVTTIRQVALAGVAFGPAEDGWRSRFPLGHLTLAVDGVLRHTLRMDTHLAHLRFNSDSQSMVLDSLHAAPEGDDSAWQLLNPYRKARLSLAMQRIRLRGVNLPAMVRQGAWRARAADVRGMVIDVLKDKNKPEDPAPNIIRRTPQGVLHDAGLILEIDTVLGQGLVTYRERAAGATAPGILTFGAMHLRGYNFTTDPRLMTATRPFRLIGDARLMGAGALHVEWTVPLLSHDFAMQWQGSLGEMDPKAMNAFLPNSVGMRFTDGTFDGGTWTATVQHGLAQGTLAPHWHNLHVELPGVARSDSGMMGSIMRGVAKLAANTFGIRSDNDTLNGDHPITATINHQWINIETLPQFIWFELRDPLLLVLKK